MDVGFEVTDKCTTCGICAKVCLAGNINYEEKKPVWKHQCEQCMACLHCCPVKAITFRGKEVTIQYQHPKIDIKELYR